MGLYRANELFRLFPPFGFYDQYMWHCTSTMTVRAWAQLSVCMCEWVHLGLGEKDKRVAHLRVRQHEGGERKVREERGQRKSIKIGGGGGFA